jgi:hypothetical protein
VATRAPLLDGETVAALIEQHHRLRRVRRGPHAEVVEAFRRADLVDVSRGVFRAGLDRAFLGELLRAFPYAGFHAMLVRTALAWALRHPTRPLPMLRF